MILLPDKEKPRLSRLERKLIAALVIMTVAAALCAFRAGQLRQQFTERSYTIER